jgi:two-component system heavy metal sensor histidine kinase CusS
MSSPSTPDRPPAARPWSLAARLTAWYAGTAFALVLGTSGFLYWALEQNLDREDDQSLRDQVHALRGVLRAGPGDPEAVRRAAALAWAARPSALVHVRVLVAGGATVAETPGMADRLPPDVFPTSAAEGAELGEPTGFRAGGHSYRLLAARVRPDSHMAAVYIIQAAWDQSQDDVLLAGYRRDMALALGLALVACAVGGYWIARRGVRPLHEITAAAGRVRPATLNERIAPVGLPAELRELAGTFNRMLDRVEESFDRLARFSADIAHELRTPLNNLRGEVEVALGKLRPAAEYRDILGSALEECDRLARMIDGLLFLARAENPATQVRREPLDLGQELAAVREFYEAAAADADVRLEVCVPGPAPARLDRALFQRAVGNLVANALAHTPSGGTVTLSALPAGDGVCVEVADTGCGIAAEHLPYLFDRFYRADRARNSAAGNIGLGLAIVKGIVELHGGRVAVASEPGRGTRLTLEFPAAVKAG